LINLARSNKNKGSRREIAIFDPFAKQARHGSMS